MKAINPNKNTESITAYAELSLNERINARHNSVSAIDDINHGGFQTAYDQLFKLTRDMWYYSTEVLRRASTPHLGAMMYPCG